MSKSEVVVMSDLEKKNMSSKKCLDLKFEREKKMFELLVSEVSNDVIVDSIGVEDWEKLSNYYSKEGRGKVVVVNYDGMSLYDVFKEYKLGVKEVVKKGYKVVNDVYYKLEK